MYEYIFMNIFANLLLNKTRKMCSSKFPKLYKKILTKSLSFSPKISVILGQQKSVLVPVCRFVLKVYERDIFMPKV